MKVVVVECVRYTIKGYDRDWLPIADRIDSSIEVFGNWTRAEEFAKRNLKRRYDYKITEYYTVDEMGRDQKVYSNEEYNIEKLKADEFEQFIVSEREVEM